MRRPCFCCGCISVCEAALIGTMAFGAGVLTALLAPPCILCGACALVLFGAGGICLTSK